MSKPQKKVHLFNCDHIYELRVVADFLNATKQKHGFEFSVEEHYFLLPQISELSEKIIPELQMDFAVFVVHAHESRLSINEDDCGYSKVYRALLQATGGNVIIVIGGDDSYKDKDEEDKEFISRWARRKIYLQFSEEFMDGRKGFIFSWNKKHREIHEKALLHFFDPSKKGEKFEYQLPKRHIPPRPTTPPPVRPSEPQAFSRPYSFLPERLYARERVQSTKQDVSVESRAHRISDQGARPKEKRSSSTETKDLSIVGEKKEDCKPQQRQSEIDPLLWCTLSLEDKPRTKYRYPIASAGHRTKEKAALHNDKADSFQRPNGSDALQCDTFRFEEKPKTKDTFLNTTYRENSTLYAERAGRVQETAPLQFKIKQQKELSVLGWKANPECFLAMNQLIQKHRHKLNLDTDPDVLNLAVNDMISYLEENLLKHCVLVVDAEKVKAARDQERGVEYLRLLQTAERNVAEKIIITVCCPRSLSKNDEWTVSRTIKEAFHDNSKVYVTWFVNGKLALIEDDFVMLFTSTIKNTELYPQQRKDATQIPFFETKQSVYARESATSGHGASRDSSYNNSFAVSGHSHHLHGKTEDRSFEPAADSFQYKIFLPTGKTLLVDTRLYEGNISRRREDVKYWMPGFDVPFEIARNLLRDNWKNSNAELVILLNEAGHLVCQVGKKRGIEWQQWIVLALDETVVLQTCLKHGKISFEDKDVVIRYPDWRVPQEEVNRLEQHYKATPKADLFVISNSKEDLRSIVQVGAMRKAFAFINTKVGNVI